MSILAFPNLNPPILRLTLRSVSAYAAQCKTTSWRFVVDKSLISNRKILDSYSPCSILSSKARCVRRFLCKFAYIYSISRLIRTLRRYVRISQMALSFSWSESHTHPVLSTLPLWWHALWWRIQ